MTNPFEKDNVPYLVLINDEGQHSLWPEFIDVPHGWTEVFRADCKADCLNYIESNWIDLRPKSLIAAMHQRAEEE